MQHIERSRLEFVRRAINYMKEHPECLTYANPDDNFLGIRWGLHDKALLVLKIDGEFKDSVIFEDIISGETSYPRFSEQNMLDFASDVIAVFSQKGITANHPDEERILFEELKQWKVAHGKQ